MCSAQRAEFFYMFYVYLFGAKRRKNLNTTDQPRRDAEHNTHQSRTSVPQGRGTINTTHLNKVLKKITIMFIEEFVCVFGAARQIFFYLYLFGAKHRKIRTQQISTSDALNTTYQPRRDAQHNLLEQNFKENNSNVY